MNENVTDPIVVRRRLAARWAATPLRDRLAVIARCRHAIAVNAEALAATNRRPLADTLSAEILRSSKPPASSSMPPPASLRPGASDTARSG